MTPIKSLKAEGYDGLPGVPTSKRQTQLVATPVILMNYQETKCDSPNYLIRDAGTW